MNRKPKRGGVPAAASRPVSPTNDRRGRTLLVDSMRRLGVPEDFITEAMGRPQPHTSARAS